MAITAARVVFKKVLYERKLQLHPCMINYETIGVTVMTTGRGRVQGPFCMGIIPEFEGMSCDYMHYVLFRGAKTTATTLVHNIISWPTVVPWLCCKGN